MTIIRILALFGLFAMFGCSKERPPARDEVAPPKNESIENVAEVKVAVVKMESVGVSVGELYQTYSDDPIRAKLLYTGKRLRVNGVVDRVYVSPLTGRVVINFGLVLADVDTEFDEEFVDVKSGALVILDGLCTGGWVEGRASDVISLRHIRLVSMTPKKQSEGK